MSLTEYMNELIIKHPYYDKGARDYNHPRSLSTFSDAIEGTLD